MSADSTSPLRFPSPRVQLISFVPAIGWTMYLQGSLFLKRNWDKDQGVMARKLADMEQGRFPRPFWIGMYPEGTRITPKKHEAALKFAEERGLPKLNNLLLPRTKGFAYVFGSLSNTVTAVYDCTTGYSKSPLYMGDLLLKGEYQNSGVHLHVRRFEASSLPKDSAALEKWMYDLFVEKDKLIDFFNENGYFPGEHRSEHDVNLPRLVLGYAFWSFVTTAVLVSLLPAKLLVLTACLGIISYSLIKSLFLPQPPSKDFRGVPTADRPTVLALKKTK